MTPMLIIRLQRVGKRNEPIFRVVVTDSKNGPKSGRFLEVLGVYDSRDKNETKVDEERVKHWISNGAQVSDTLHNLFVSKGIIDGKKKNVLPRKSPVVKEAEEKTEEAPVEEGKEEAPTEEPKVEESEEKVEESVEEVKEEKTEEPAEEAPTE
jgi:small subunit ribosomal protein S16